MAGSPRSKVTNTRTLLLALLAAFSLFAAACGGSDSTAQTVEDLDTAAETATEAVDDATSDAAESVEPAADAKKDEASEDSEAPEDAPKKDVEEAEPVEDVEEATPADDVEASDSESAGSTGPMAQVLSFALENSESQSYSFTQGMSMKMNIAGQELNIESDEPFVFGEVDGSDMHMEMDMGIFMGSMMSSLGIDVTQAPFDEMFNGLSEARIETWSNETTMVMDMSRFANTIGALDPEAAGELADFADGPIKIDLTQLEGVDAATVATELGQGAQVTDPAAILQALRAVDAVTETGSDTVNGVAVTTFEADMALTDYYDALGLDVTDQLGAANLGDVSAEEAATVEAVLSSLSEVSMTLTVMIDGDDLVRRMETGIDMGAMLSAMFDNPDVLAAIAAEEGQSVEALEAEMSGFLGEGLELRIDTWQEFDNYGTAIVTEAPEAVDVTAEFDLAS